MAPDELPHCDDLFLRFFDRWYDDDDRKRKRFKATCPDVFSGIYKKGTPASKLTPLIGDTLTKVAAQIDRMIESARGDWATDFNCPNPVSLKGIEDFDRYYDAARIQKVLDRSNAEDFSNEYLVLCCELGAVLGKVLKDLRPDLEWVWEWPYWESYLWDSATSDQFKVVHWAIKKMSGYGVDDGLADKVRAVAQWKTSSEE